MDVYNTEEEQVQAIKKWWKENSLSIIAGIVIGASILGGYSYWNKNKQMQAQQASVIYSYFSFFNFVTLNFLVFLTIIPSRLV